MASNAARTGRLISRGAVLLVLMSVLAISLAGAASAHNVLISSTPAEGAVVPDAPTSLSFTFDQPVQNFDPVVSLIGPDGKQYATGTPTISGNTVTGSVGAGPAGTNTAAYRVVSSDGHPVTGQVHFSLAGDDGGPEPSGAAATGSARTGVPSGGSTTVAAALLPGSGAGGSSGLSGWLWIGLIVAAVLIATAAVLLIRRPEKDPPAGY